MFHGLETFNPIEGAIAENCQTSSTTPLPAIRFGASKIPLELNTTTPNIVINESLQPTTNIPEYTVFITGVIGHHTSYCAELITLLRTLPQSSQVKVYISSPGGSLAGGAMISAAIHQCKAHVTTHAIGVVASSAALIWSYGHTKEVSDGAVLMFHMSSHGDYGNSQEIKTAAENTVRYVKEVAIDPLVMMGILTEEDAEIIIDRRQNRWFDSTTIQARLEKCHAK